MSCLLTLAALALAFAGCRPKGADEPPSELWLSVHCAGTSAIASNAHSARLREMAALPASDALQTALKEKLVTSLQQTLLRTTNPPAPDAGDLILPLLDEALAREFLFEIHGRSNAPAAWMLVVSLEGDLARRWETNYRALVARLDLGEIKKFNARSFGGWYVTQPDKRAIDYLEIGKWVIVGMGIDRRPMLAALERIDKQGRPAPALGEAWLRAGGDLARLRPTSPSVDALTWPRFDLTVTGKDTNVVADAKLVFPQPFAAGLPAWNIPTNLVQDPVISFTAARGIAGLVRSLPLHAKLGLTNAPDQAVFWAQTQIPFQSHVAAPLHDAGNSLNEIARRLPEALGTNLQDRAFGEIRWASNRVDLIWAGLPVVVPYLRAAKGADGGEVLFGGLFPPRDTHQPLPAELLRQLERTDLVYYDWEITEERLQQWRQLWQLWALATFRPALDKPIAQARVIEAIGPFLGNCVTEITRTGPNELSFLRKSHLGLTGFELVALSRVVDRFVSGPPRPMPGLRAPPPAPAPSKP